MCYEFEYEMLQRLAEEKRRQMEAEERAKQKPAPRVPDVKEGEPVPA